MKTVLLSLVPLALVASALAEEWEDAVVPMSWNDSVQKWFRCWVKVPDHWTVMTGRSLWRESVTFTVTEVADVHEVYVNGQRIGGEGTFPPRFGKATGERITRYKIPPGLLPKGQWNEVVVRVFNKGPHGGFRGGAPSIQGYFLECILEGQWESWRGGRAPLGKALVKKPARAAYETFVEASRILGEAKELVPGPRKTPAESLALLSTDADLVVEELLAEPLVAQPTHLSFDDRGRLWISHFRQYPYPAGLKQISRDKYYRAKYDQEPKAPPGHYPGRSKITVHEDSNQDGRFDRHTVFLDGLDLANAALPDHDGVWVMHTPYLLFYPDRDRDDKPDGDPEIHLAGFGFEDTHSIANGLAWGPDGWIYGGQGSTVASRIWSPRKDPARRSAVYFEGCMTWRYHPHRETFEVFAEGGGNVFGLDFDSDGRLFSGHNGGNTRGWHYLQSGYFLKQGRTPNKFGPVANPFAFGDLPEMRSTNPIPRFSHATILCEGSAMPGRMQGRFLSADPLHHHLVLSERRQRGSTFETTDLGKPLESSDEAFRPVYLCNAPDGSVYVADFYDFYIAHGQHYQSQIDPTTGRIYRLRGRSQKLERDINLAGKSSEELVALLKHPNKWHRQMAVRLLGRRVRDEENHASLSRWVRDQEGREVLGGVWSLFQGGGWSRELGEALLKHPYPPVRAWAVRLLGERGETGSLTEMRELAKREEDLEVWNQLASTVMKQESSRGMPVIGELLKRSGDLEDPCVPLMLWWALEKHALEGEDLMITLFRDPEIRKQPMVRREILPRVMRRYAASGRESGLLMCARLLKLCEAEEERKALMLGFEQAFTGGVVPALPPELSEALAVGGELSLVLRLRRGEEGAAAEAGKIIRDPRAEREQRLRLIRTLGELGREGSEDILLGVVQGESDVMLRRAALTGLQAFSSPRIGKEILKQWDSLAGDLRPAGEALLAGRRSFSVEWLEAIEAGHVKAEATSLEAIALLRSYQGKRITALVRKHFGEGAAPLRSAREEVARIRQIVDGVVGSPYRGRPIFKQRCASCHILFHEGGKLGPDLTAYQRDDLETMLTSIVDPGATIREGFEGVQVTTTDQRLLVGFVVDNGPRTMTLRGFDGSEIALARKFVKETKSLGRSLMPDGILDGLSDQELRDLFAYLRSSQPFLKD
jgi:putative membrane-bound dehydrogenase-like protein